MNSWDPIPENDRILQSVISKRMDEQTKKHRTLMWVYGIMSMIATVLPLIAYVIVGFSMGDVSTGQKFTLGFAITFAMILVAMNLLGKYSFRSPLFVVLLGLMYSLQAHIEIMIQILLVVCVGTIIDEFWFTPCHDKHKRCYEINKQIDKRG